ncbi:hypothetical protein GII36_05500 [Candidatus Mycosynbacter amalyticus]|uniref:WxL domain-containing protein n=1 Tax=Candidatus Mycosynbacter amalyticus TaxID=2665156 RepID=A0A857ML26_9BACT|nr:hypothetical protein [Candidatus Mycosynbacter amalyticus]QHN43273.1 hypothetical protein GII36_05500 [Candidatus Mycosynbacter amalyticus]
MYTLKSIVRRGTMLGAATAVFAAALVPAVPAFADALNPLTDRSLLLSSSAPGFVDTDGSGYSTAAPNPAAGGNVPATYAPAGSGPNGMKTGETFTFKTSSTATIKGFTFQYCTTAAGYCQSPGNNTGDQRTTDRETNAAAKPNNRSDLDITNGANVFTQSTGLPPGAGEFQVSINGVKTTAADWTMTAVNKEDTAFNNGNSATSRLSGKSNFITLTSATGQSIAQNASVKIQFTASESHYITNPGAGSFFVKINTYNDDTTQDDSTLVDGGVTVANVMTDSIHITTKVLETMAFSVGTQNPDTVVKAQWNDHGTCDSITQLNNNRLNLGNPAAENSLETGRGWDVSSYWRLSSNSSGGATVYYSGNTLANTVGDKIAPMTTKGTSKPGTEQFGLGFVPAVTTNAGADSGDTLSSSYADAMTNEPTRYKSPTSYPFITLTGQTSSAPFDTLAAQPVSADYADARGTLDNGSGGAGTAQFKFLPTSITVPEPIAQENERVISCATAKMRYVGNIGADTPAGVYTTKINYLAAPQY